MLGKVATLVVPPKPFNATFQYPSTAAPPPCNDPCSHHDTHLVLGLSAFGDRCCSRCRNPNSVRVGQRRAGSPILGANGLVFRAGPPIAHPLQIIRVRLVALFSQIPLPLALRRDGAVGRAVAQAVAQPTGRVSDQSFG
jgi:hypothetical protein